MMKVEVEEKDKVVVVNLAGELSLKGIEEFEYAFKKYANSGLDVIALDLKYVPYLDSFGISRIIKMSRLFIGSGTEFVLVNMNDHIHQIFRMSTFDRLFNIMTREEFDCTYFPVDRLIEDVNTGNTAGVTEPGGVQKDTKNTNATPVEHKDNTGTTLVFLDEE